LPLYVRGSLDHEGLSDEERLALTQMYDEMGWIDSIEEEGEAD
jgi:hypothetical protein